MMQAQSLSTWDVGEIKNILKSRNHAVIRENGSVDAVVIGSEDYEEVKRFLHAQYVREKLAEVEAVEDDPSTWITEEAFWDNLEEFMKTLPVEKNAV
jgi:hypothetical protein